MLLPLAHVRGHGAIAEQDVVLVVQIEASAIHVRRADQRDLPVDGQRLGVQQSGAVFVDLHAGGEQTRAIASAAELSDTSAVGGRFTDNDTRPPPTLAWILAYVLQEYSRHAGHLDVARELIDGTTGE